MTQCLFLKETKLKADESAGQILKKESRWHTANFLFQISDTYRVTDWDGETKSWDSSLINQVHCRFSQWNLLTL